jgi:protein PhnA
MSDDDIEPTKDSNGNILNDGDSVTVIKDLPIKGSSKSIKRGTVVRGIRTTNDPREVEGKVDGMRGLVLKTEFLRKVS